ncbi:MAG TPA: hypothetical protein PLR26_03185 [Bacilli bacterium]|nr:hypothetical protein [Bacilli bacterium]
MIDYQKIFQHLPYLEDAASNGLTQTIGIPSNQLVNFVEDCYASGIIQPEARKLLVGNSIINPNTIKEQVPSLSYEILVALLTILVMDDERIDGLLESNISNGVVYEIVKTIEAIVLKEMKIPSKNKYSS